MGLRLLGEMWKEAVVTCYNVLSQHLSDETQKITVHPNQGSRLPNPELKEGAPKFEAGLHDSLTESLLRT
jgi:hypothetical protein